MAKSQLPIIAVDFDGPLCDQAEIVHQAAESLAYLVDKGFRVVIHTQRAKSPSGASYVAQFLDERDIPYHEITAIKPNAVLFIDDRALRFDSWAQALADIERLAPTLDS